MSDVNLSDKIKYKVDTLDSDEDKVAKLEKLLKKRKHKGEFFLPDTDFYNMTLIDKASCIMDWIGIESNAKLWIEFNEDIEPAGLYFYNEENKTHYILINSNSAGSTYRSAAVLAHELMHFILLGIYKYRLEDTLQNEILTDIATVYCGLGVIVANGFEYSNGWATTVLGLMFGALSINTKSNSFGYFKPKEYVAIVSDFSKSWNINANQFSGYFLPWTRHFLPPNIRAATYRTSNQSEIVKYARKQEWKTNAIKIGIVIVFIPITIFVWNIRSTSNTSTNPNSEVQKNLNSLQSAVDEVKATYDTCVTEMTNMKYNLDSLNKQMESYKTGGNIDSYNALISTQNQQANEYNAKQGECEALRIQHNEKVENYNKYLKENQ